ncbi:VOC family protein [Vibrio sp. WXL103]|uniref:VOC family protein n=1 Tax=unclassified Vibrio TaxID=2614977 RepID=UPI003EC90F64
MKKFNHVGIPTSNKHANETLNAEIGVYTTDFSQSEHKIEWLRFVDGSPMPDELKNTAHIAYEVDDLDRAMQGKKVLIEPFYANESLKIAFVMEDEAPVELMQYV